MVCRVFIVFLAIFAGSLALAQDTYKTHIFKGNKNFDRKDYEQASKHYLEAAKKQEKDFGAHYNLGNAFYKKKMYKEAIAEYEKAQQLTKNQLEKSAAQYNLGNAYMQNNEVEKAAEQYRKALSNDSGNEAIIKNLQIAKKKQKEKQDKKQQQQNQQNQNQQNQPNQQPNKNENQSQGQNQNPQKGNEDSNNQKDPSQQGKSPMDMYAPKNDQLRNQREKQEGSGNNGQQNQGTQGNNPNQQKSENENKNIPKDLEDALMRRIGEAEKNTARRVLNNKKGYAQPQSNEKDW